MIIIRYYSRTQLYVVLAPFVFATFAIFALVFWKGDSWLLAAGPQSTIAASVWWLSFAWLFVGGEIMVRAYERGKRKLGFIDISRNPSPSPLERKLIRIANWSALAPVFGFPFLAFGGHMYLLTNHSLTNRGQVLMFVMGLAVSALVGAVVHFLFVTTVLMVSGFRVRPLIDR